MEGLMPVRYVKEYSAEFHVERQGRTHRKELLWGDPCEVIENAVDGRTKVWARGEEGWVNSEDLGDESLLEIYVIDVGQGDGVLVKTPDGKWHLVDAGVSNESQMTKKGAANFLRWKFYEDLRREEVDLDNVILSHPDFDHYGGLLNLLRGHLPAAGGPARDFKIRVKNFYHSGMGRFAGEDPLGGTMKGKVAEFPQGFHGIRETGTFITELLDGVSDFREPKRAFAEPFSELADLVSRVPENVRRLTASDQHLPGYAPDENACTVSVLGPIVEQLDNGSEGLRWLTDKSKTRNGHSIVLRLDYGNARVLLTGDLNEESQQLLLSYQPRESFAVDVAKGCHHGSDDIDLQFVKAMGARATIVSSGDNEDYAHPRPRVLGASARYGREALDVGGKVLPPLLYSTELARSVKLAYASRISVRGAPGGALVDINVDVDHPIVSPTGKEDRPRPLARAALAVDLVYGLVNVRTDGKTILLATLEEKGSEFDIRVFQAGESPA
jgi:beta-lactamase superfamily II metal-dependent hydrolase